MDKYKTNSAFNTWFSFIQLEQLPSAARGEHHLIANFLGSCRHWILKS